MKMRALEHDVGDYTEYGQRDTLLNDLQLNEVERTAVFHKTYAVGGNLATVFKEGNHPRESDDANEWPVAGCAGLL